MYLYSGLLLSESEGADEEYVYASEMRIVSAITAQRLDVVLMDAEARDAFAAQGYLADLSSLIPGLACQWLDVSQTPLIRQAGFPEAVYLGVLANAPHPRARRPLISTICLHKKGRTVHGYFGNR